MVGIRHAERAGWLLAGILLGAAVSATADSERVETLFRKLEVLAEVLGQIENHYVDVVSPTDLVYGAAQGAAGVLDEHSAFFTPDEYRSLLTATEGEYPGLGVELGMLEGVPEVVAVFEDSPAARAGILAGDLLLGVDGEVIEGWNLERVQQRLRGPAGSKVVLHVRRGDREQPWSFTIVRGWVRISPIERRTLGPGLEYVRIKSFSRRVAADFEAMLASHPPAAGLVLDLRGNPGGLFDEAVTICDMFLEDGLIVSAIGKGGRVIERQEAHARDTQPDYPVAILIDRGSASAAEVVAGSLRDRGRARLFGSRSYGKGSVQSILDLTDGSGLKLTVARYLTPSGVQIDGQGIEPDEALSAGPEEDGPLLAAREWITAEARARHR